MISSLPNFFIASVLKRKCLHFKGVYSADNIDMSLSELESFNIVCNLSNFGENGTHWISIIASPTFIMYIDPLGIQCFNDKIYDFLISCNRSLFFNIKTIQPIKSNFCGFFCNNVLYVF